MANRRASSATLSCVANEMLMSLGLDQELDPELVFEIQAKEGAGAFGRVFRACYKSDPSRLAALKVIPVALEAGQRGEDIETVRREIQFLRECDHPNVVAFYGAYYKDGALWVAMEYCGGGSVGDVSRTRRLGEHEIACIMRGALNGLAYLHSKKKIHRDIKGGNILLTANGQVKIADFGVSAQLRDTMSRRGTFVGTPYWMSPEMIQDSDYDYKSDIWSLGITAIELADQKPPLFDEHPMRVLIQIPRNPPPQLKCARAWTPAFAHFLAFCLQKDPLERPSALECLEHGFIRDVDHIERVFARAEQQEQSSAPEVSPVGLQERIELAQDLMVARSIVRDAGVEALADAVNSDSMELGGRDGGGGDEDECGENEDIAEDIDRLDDDSESANDSEEDTAIEGACELISGGVEERNGADDDDDDGSSDSDASSSTADELFHFRQPPPAASEAEIDSQESFASMVSGDELLQLSVSESVDLPFQMKNQTLFPLPTAAAPPVRSLLLTSDASSPVEQSHLALTPAASRPPTEFKLLLPSASRSPLPKPKTNKQSGDWFSPATNSSIGRNLDNKSSKPAPKSHNNSQQQQQQQRIPSKQQSVVVTTPKQLSSVSSSWQNPLSDVHHMASSHARVNVLLSSINSSLSCSTRMFTKLLQDEVELQKLDQNSLSASVSASAAGIQPPLPTRASLSGSTTASHFIGGPFRVAHDVSVQFNSVDARFEGAPASEEWAVLHQQFGIPLAQMRCRTSTNTNSASGDDHLVPALLHMLRRELLKRDGLTTKFIYRASPEQNEVQGVKKAINSGSVDHASVSDPHVYASLVKHWLRDLPVKLLATLKIDDIVEIGKLQRVDSTISNGRHSMITEVLGKLPQQERAVLEWLLNHMLEVMEKSLVNKMTAQSIAVVMAPNLFSCESQVSKTLQGSSDTVNSVIDFLCALLTWKYKTTGGRGDEGTGGARNLARSLSFTRSPGVETRASGQLPHTRSFATKSRSHGLTSLEPTDSSSLERFEDTSHSLIDYDQSLEEMVKLTVDDLWSELGAHGIDSVEMLLTEKRMLSERFESYQRSMLELIARFSKRSEDRDWAATIFMKLGDRISLENLSIPSSLNHLRRWVRAALSVDEFLSQMRSEKTIREKLERLRSRFPMASGTRRSSSGDGGARTLDPERVHDLFHQISVVSLEKLTSAAATRENQESTYDDDHHAGQDTNTTLLLEGALRLLRFNAETENQSELSVRAEEIARCAESEPAIGKLLAGLSQSTRLAHLGLESRQQQLATTVQSTLQIHQRLQCETSTLKYRE